MVYRLSEHMLQGTNHNPFAPEPEDIGYIQHGSIVISLPEIRLLKMSTRSQQRPVKGY